MRIEHTVQCVKSKMTTLQATVTALKARYDAAQVEANKIHQELWKAEAELKAQQMKALSKKTKDYYLMRLKRLKRDMVDWMGFNGGHKVWSDITVAFHKREGPYENDWHEEMDDPLDWTLAEYDLLAMGDYLEIRIDYFNEAVKEFVTVWFKTHAKDVHFVDEKSMFAFKRYEK